jgi:hypothetical protein
MGRACSRAVLAALVGLGAAACSSCGGAEQGHGGAPGGGGASGSESLGSHRRRAREGRRTGVEAAPPDNARPGAAIDIALSQWTIDVGGKRISETGRMKRSDLAQHTVGDRALVKLLPAVRAAVDASGEAAVYARISLDPKTPLWFAEIAIGAVFWDARVRYAEVTSEAGALRVLRPAGACSAEAPTCAAPALLVRDGGVLVLAIASDARGSVPCGEAPPWNRSAEGTAAGNACESFALKAPAQTVSEDLALAQGHGAACGFVAVHSMGDALWQQVEPVLRAGDARAIVFMNVAAPEGCAPEPTKEESVD